MFEKKCINCDSFVICPFASEDTIRCLGFKKANRNIKYFTGGKIIITNEREDKKKIK